MLCRQRARTIARLAPAVCLATAIGAQSPAGDASLRFEAASVKPSGPSKIPGMLLQGTNIRGNRYTATNATLLTLLRSAYVDRMPLMPDEVAGGPPWLDTDRFDVTAVAPEGATRDQFPVMVRALLADRFGLVIRPDTREMPAYVLRVSSRSGQLGPSLRPVTADCPAERPAVVLPLREAFPCDTLMATGPGSTRVSGRMVEFQALVRILKGALRAPVVDRTGLTGMFDRGQRTRAPDCAA